MLSVHLLSISRTVLYSHQGAVGTGKSADSLLPHSLGLTHSQLFRTFSGTTLFITGAEGYVYKKGSLAELENIENFIPGP